MERPEQPVLAFSFLSTDTWLTRSRMGEREEECDVQSNLVL